MGAGGEALLRSVRSLHFLTEMKRTQVKRVCENVVLLHYAAGV
jgi:hypothetical protein